MNKQEAIKCIEQMGEYEHFVGDPISKASVLSIISQIHEPQKVVVPKFIADSIEYCKNKEGYGLLRAMDYCDEYNDTGEWLEHNQETFALAWLFGYEIEQEKLYTVELPNPNNIGTEVHILMMNGFKQVVIKKRAR
ncbi:TPA: DUF1642 domain-containing protein [Streptococcus suis]|nr:DUF1642 domain-containing protein [Streptococcus suis]HEM4700452.1 DUF1642 domain-containing protein [Streptococcus suis]HEM4746746.1 DUF1642 domain-containing protein [Streptococcus suis]HEM4893957.1 DUF1642 domain-containing protein [Streptococcus suis]HEM4913601.1 DUF1642 domain-containing protein [Streptococcus suis]